MSNFMSTRWFAWGVFTFLDVLVFMFLGTSLLHLFINSLVLNPILAVGIEYRAWHVMYGEAHVFLKKLWGNLCTSSQKATPTK